MLLHRIQFHIQLNEVQDDNSIPQIHKPSQKNHLNFQIQYAIEQPTVKVHRTSNDILGNTG